MWESIWKWIKRILFIVVMLISVGCSIAMFGDISGGLNIFLGILTILFAISSCVLYFIFNEYKKWPIVLTLIALFGISFYLAMTIEANIYGICSLCAFFGFIISCGVKWLKSESYGGIKDKLLKIAYALGIIAGIAGGIYMLFFNK